MIVKMENTIANQEQKTGRTYDLQIEITATLSDAQAYMRAGDNVKAYDLINLAKTYIIESNLEQRVTKEQLAEWQSKSKKNI